MKTSNKDSNKEKKKMSFYRERANNVIITVKFFLLVGLLKITLFPLFLL